MPEMGGGQVSQDQMVMHQKEMENFVPSVELRDTKLQIVGKTPCVHGVGKWDILERFVGLNAIYVACKDIVPSHVTYIQDKCLCLVPALLAKEFMTQTFIIMKILVC